MENPHNETPPTKAGLTSKEDKDEGKSSSAGDVASSRTRCPLRHDASYSDSDLTDNSSGERGQVRAEKLYADGQDDDDGVCVCVCFRCG